MARIDVRFKIEKLQIRQYPRAELVAGGKNYFYAIFEVCDTWGEIKSAKALFTRGEISKLMDLTEGEYGLECAIPWEVMAEPGVFTVGIFGGDRLLTNTDYVKVREGVMTDGEEPLAPTPDWFTKMEEDMKNAKRGTQVDWNQNDAKGSDHIKNRPFHIIDSAECTVYDRKIVATFKEPLELGQQFWYGYTVDGVDTVSGCTKPLKVLDTDSTKYTVTMGNKYGTDYALVGTCDIGSNVIEFEYFSENEYDMPTINRCDIVKTIPFEYLGLSDGVMLGYGNKMSEKSENSNIFGSLSEIDGNYNNIFGTNNKIKGQSSAIFGQDSTILANLCYLFGDRNHSTGRCTFGVGTLIDMLGINSGAIGYGLIVSGDHQFVAGRFNEPDKDASIIIGDGADDANRSNSFVVKKDGRIYIKEEMLLKLTQKDRDKLNSFSSTGDQNSDTGKSTAQFGFKNKNAQDNVMQFGRENTTEGSKGGYIYQIGFSNSSAAGQNYLFGRNLKSAVYEQFVLGKYNEEDKDALFILGNGTSTSARKNAFVVKKTNDVHFEGNIYSKGNKVLTSSDLNTFSGTIASLITKIEELENERIALNDSITFMQSDLNALSERVAALENKS